MPARGALVVGLVLAGCTPGQVAGTSNDNPSRSATQSDQSTGPTTGLEARSPDTGTSDATFYFADFALGPYLSAHDLLLKALNYWSSDYNCTVTTSSGYNEYGDVVAEAYLIQAAARYLQAVRNDTGLPGGETERQQVAADAFTLADNLLSCDDKTLQGAPGWGKDQAFDAFGDGTVNPAYTEYAWEDGMVLLGFAELAAYIKSDVARFSADQTAADNLMVVAQQVLAKYQTGAYTPIPGHTGWSCYWYSLSSNDANKCVFNTTGLLSTAEQIIDQVNGYPADAYRAVDNFDYFRDGALVAKTVGADTAYVWKYGGYGTSYTKYEDTSHASHNEDWLRFELDQGAFSPTQARELQNTAFDLIFKAGNPGCVSEYVDGTSDSTGGCQYTAASAIGISTLGDAVAASGGGRVDAWDLAKDILISGELQPNDDALAGATVVPIDAITIANLFLHRPSELAPDSKWVVVAGPGDESTPTGSGDVRFYPSSTPEWTLPTAIADPAHPAVNGVTVRTSTDASANLAVDLPSGTTGPVVVSITYRSKTTAAVQQWTGSSYVTLAPMPATTVNLSGVSTPVFYRVTFRLDQAAYYDYQPTVAGINVLLQVTQTGMDVYKIEATPL